MKNKILLYCCILCLQVQAQDYQGVDEFALTDTRVSGIIDDKLPPMAIPATERERAKFLERNTSESFYIFPETRNYPIELFHTIPQRWANSTTASRTELQVEVNPGEYYIFQLGVYAPHTPVTITRYEDKGLTDLTCYNMEGYSNLGTFFQKEINIAKGDVQPLWFGIPIPENQSKPIKGKISLITSEGKKQTVKIMLTPNQKKAENQGLNDDWRLSRLKWLNSRIEQNEEVTAGFQPIAYNNQHISITGRDIELAPSGFPKAINSYFDSGNMKLKPQKEPILSEDICFEIETEEGKLIELQYGKLKITQKTPRRILWEATHQSEILSMRILGEATCEGFMDYQVKVTPKKDVRIKDIRLKVPMTAEKSLFMMGMGKEGGYRPANWQWKWDEEKSQDMVWVGGINGGLALKLKDEHYKKQLVNIYYPYGKLNLPKSWCNDSQGGCRIQSQEHNTVIQAYSGQRQLRKGESLNFNFELLITPFKTLTTQALFKERFYQNSNEDKADNYLKNADQVGANIITIHHKKDLNPFINYPYLSDNAPRLKQYVDTVHAAGKRLCLYYTTRELTVNTPEIWAFRSLGPEIIFPGAGKDIRTVINPDGPHPWLNQRFQENFIPAWRCSIQEGRYAGKQDLSVITTPESRLDNFFLEGLDWLCKNTEIDGIYLDGTALDRNALRRARKILDKTRPSALIDVHIWNNFREKGCYANGINLYMDLLPFTDHLWIGEGRSYDRMPDYWLVEMSGIPFGVPSQMLNQGGNRWRGMVFGLTNRPGWYGPTPKYIWQFWDEHRISEMEMYGFWHKEVPVHTDNSMLYATAYCSKDEVIISVANWDNESHVGRLYVDWEKLGFNPNEVTCKIPYIKEFQEEKDINLNAPLKVKGKEGYLIVIRRK